MRFAFGLVIVLSAYLGACAQGTTGDPYGGQGAATSGTGGSAGQGASGGAGSGGKAGSGGGGTGGSSGGGTGGSGGGTAGSGGGTGGSGGNNGCTPPVAGGTCSIVPACGCNGGEACDVAYTNGQTECYQTKNIPKGDVCSGLGVCSPGLSCVGGACKPVCRDANDCGASGSECFQVQASAADGGVSDIPEFKVCTDQCSLSDPSARCGDGATCVFLSNVGETPGLSSCIASGGSSTSSCSSDPSSCAPGWGCTADGTCNQWCRIGSNDCPSGMKCYTISDGAGATGIYVGAQQFGLCNY
jgi:hypothetical protein